ncbi:hypothetical protein EJB05_43604, partial [Eragrostis curvula]
MDVDVNQGTIDGARALGRLHPFGNYSNVASLFLLSDHCRIIAGSRPAFSSFAPNSLPPPRPRPLPDPERCTAICSMDDQAVKVSPADPPDLQPKVHGGRDFKNFVMDDFFRDLATKVAPSVVIVEDIATGSFWSGCVIHKTKRDTFILTQERIHRPKLLVHFSDYSTKPAEFLGSHSGFAVIATGEPHESCRSINLSDPINDTDVLTLVPKSRSSFEDVKGFITKASCCSTSGDGPVDSVVPATRDYFIASCCHPWTIVMVTTPVFNKNGEANGFVISDCRNAKMYGMTHKVCIRPFVVKRILKSMMEEENWKHQLSVLSDRARSTREKEARRTRKRLRQQARDIKIAARQRKKARSA